jgi:hypothetical protein
MSILESIVQFDVAKESDTQAYGVLVDAARFGDSVSDKESFNYLCQLGETDYMERFHHNTEGAKKKSGEWKFRTFLPPAYSSAKSVIGTALELHIPLVDENYNNMGKSALQRAIKEAKEGSKETKTELEKAQGMLDSVAKIAAWMKCNSRELDALLDSVDWLRDTIRNIS